MQSQITGWGEALLASLTDALAMFFSAIPKVLGFAVIIIVGWLIASLIEKTVKTLLRAINFNHLAERSGFAGFVGRLGGHADASQAIALIVKWFVRLMVLVVAFDALGLPAVSDVLRQLLLWLPNLVVALVVLVIGGIAAGALSRIVRAAAYQGGLENPDFLAKVSSIAVWAFTIVVAVSQIGIATALVHTLFMAAAGAIALALGLAFGLGGRETAGEILRDWYRRSKERARELEKTTDIAIDMSKNNGDPTKTVHRG